MFLPAADRRKWRHGKAPAPRRTADRGQCAPQHAIKDRRRNRMHSREIDRLRAELVHLDATMQLFDPETDPSDVPALRRYPRRTEWFARGEVTQRVYEAFREQEIIWPREIAKRAMLEKGIAETDKKVLRDIVARFTNVAYDLTRRGKLVKIGHGQGARWKLAPTDLNCFRPLPGRAASSRRNRRSAYCASPARRSGQPASRSRPPVVLAPCRLLCEPEQVWAGDMVMMSNLASAHPTKRNSRRHWC